MIRKHVLEYEDYVLYYRTFCLTGRKLPASITTALSEIRIRPV